MEMGIPYWFSEWTSGGANSVVLRLLTTPAIALLTPSSPLLSTSTLLLLLLSLSAKFSKLGHGTRLETFTGTGTTSTTGAVGFNVNRRRLISMVLVQ